MASLIFKILLYWILNYTRCSPKSIIEIFIIVKPQDNQEIWYSYPRHATGFLNFMNVR